MQRFRLGIAECKASVAVQCASKQEAAKNCASIQDNPEEISRVMVEKMCRRFGVPAAAKADNELYKVASRWYDSDPALADQLGDTADKSTVDKKKLGIMSYLFGDGDYGAKLKTRAAELRTVIEKLKAAGVNDAETVSVLESQAQSFDAEGAKFSNFFDISRLGGLFGG